jgi:acylphosphatase
MKTLRIHISGTVQGVLFRRFIEENANRIGVRGYVRNLDDGRVEVVVEGVDNKVLEMVEIAKKGNPHSMVRQVEINPITHQGFVGFKILRI